MRLLATILRVLIGARLSDSILGDLEEGRRARSPRSPVRARLWFVTSLVAVLAYALLSRVRGFFTRWREMGDLMSKLQADCRHAFRSLTAQRGASLAIVLVLALGVGLTAAMFAIADPFVFQRLPYPDADELVVIRTGHDGVTPEAEIPSVTDWRGHTDLFRSVVGHRLGLRYRLRLPERSVRLRTMEVTSGFLSVLGQPDLSVTDSAGGVGRPVILTAAGKAALELGDEVVGRTLPVQPSGEDGSTGELRVVATLSPAFVYPAQARSGVVREVDALIPIAPTTRVMEVTDWADGRPARWEAMTVIARLQPGVGVEAVTAALARPLPSGAHLEIDVESLADDLTGSARPLALGAMIAVSLILLVCAGNVANLLLARSAFRGRELSTREALGASRLDLARLLLVEVALLTACALALGLGLARATLLGVREVIPDEYVLLGAPGITGRVALVALLAGCTVMTAGVLPTLFAWRGTRRPGLGRQASEHAPGLRVLRLGFAGGQCALAMILALGAALLLQSYANLIGQETGFDPDAVVVTVSYPPDRSTSAMQEDIEASLESLRRLPGVGAASASIGPLVDNSMTGMMVRIDGEFLPVNYTAVEPAFFDAAGMTLLQGRGLSAADAETGIVINETMARTHWPDRSPIGDLVGPRDYQVVGVVADVLHSALDVPPEPAVFGILDQPRSATRPVHYVLRADGTAASYREAARRALSGVNPDAVIEQVDTLGERLASSVHDRTFATLLLTLFGVAGISVTLAGLVGIVAFIVARRTREIAIRVAIGAQRHHVRRLVVGEAIGAATVGTITGLLVGRWLSAWLESLVFGIEVGNWTTALAAAAALLGVAVLTALVPARRALALTPTEALRAE